MEVSCPELRVHRQTFLVDFDFGFHGAVARIEDPDMSAHLYRGFFPVDPDHGGLSPGRSAYGCLDDLTW